jgi:PTS system mannose-specific IID component
MNNDKKNNDYKQYLKPFSEQETPQKLPSGTYEPVLNKADLDRCGIRWNMAVLTFNYMTQLAPSCVFSTYYALRKIYRGDEEGFKKALTNQFRYFNATPPASGLLLGAGLALEDKGHNNALEAENDLKVGLMGSLSGVADTIFWILIPTIMGSIAASLAQSGNPVGIFIWLAVWTPLWIWKIHNWNDGYKFGTSLLTTMSGKIALFTEAMSVLGLTVVGALIPTTVVISTPITFAMGDVSLSLQTGVLDLILPSLLSVLATYIVYKLVKKHTNMNLIILGIIVICCICAAFGILQ